MVLEKLDALREQFDACKLVGLADISSGVVLGVSAAEKPPQEKLDAYCRATAEMLDGKSALAFGAALGGEALHEASVMSDSQILFFVRAEQDPSEAMFCVCTAEIDTEKFLPAAQDSLKHLIDPGGET